MTRRCTSSRPPSGPKDRKHEEGTKEKEQQEKLLTIKGIGPKVCNCIMLFGLNNTKRFPIDVWIKRKMQDLYFEGKEVSNLEIKLKNYLEILKALLNNTYFTLELVRSFSI